MTEIINDDVRTAEDARDSLKAVVSAYTALLTSIEQHRANQVAMKLEGEVLTFLDAQRDAVVGLLAAAERAVQRAEEHVQRANDGVRSDPTLAGVIADTYVGTASV